jgi:GTP-binding protein HflX
VIQSRHLDEGTELHIRVDERLAAELAEFRR